MCPLQVNDWQLLYHLGPILMFLLLLPPRHDVVVAEVPEVIEEPAVEPVAEPEVSGGC